MRRTDSKSREGLAVLCLLVAMIFRFPWSLLRSTLCDSSVLCPPWTYSIRIQLSFRLPLVFLALWLKNQIISFTAEHAEHPQFGKAPSTSLNCLPMKVLPSQPERESCRNTGVEAQRPVSWYTTSSTNIQMCKDSNSGSWERNPTIPVNKESQRLPPETLSPQNTCSLEAKRVEILREGWFHPQHQLSQGLAMPTGKTTWNCSQECRFPA